MSFSDESERVRSMASCLLEPLLAFNSLAWVMASARVWVGCDKGGLVSFEVLEEVFPSSRACLFFYQTFRLRGCKTRFKAYSCFYSRKG